MTYDIAIEYFTRSIPSNWSVLPFRRMATLIADTNTASRDTLLSLSSTGILAPRADFDGLGRQAPSEDTIERYWLVRPGHLVVNPMWLTGGGIGVSNLAGAVSPDYRVYRLDAGIHPRFAHHLLRSQPYRDQYKLYTRADTTFDRRVSKVDFHSMPLIVPPITEQRRIANFLDTEISRIDALLTARTRQLDILEQRRSIFERTAIAGGFSATAIDSGVPWIGKVDQQVTLVPLQRIVTLQRGVDLTEEQRRPGAVPVVTTAGVSGFHSHSIAPGPGVVVGRYGSAGSVHWVERDFWPHNTTLYVKNFNGNLPKYCFYVLRNLPYEMEQARSAIPGINRNDIHKRIMPLAPLKDQEHIASCIDSYTARTDAATAAINEGIALLTERRQALITAAVTGQIDVTTARGVSESEGVAV